MIMVDWMLIAFLIIIHKSSSSGRVKISVAVSRLLTILRAACLGAMLAMVWIISAFCLFLQFILELMIWLAPILIGFFSLLRAASHLDRSLR